MAKPQPIRLLLLNPNSSQEMTRNMLRAAMSLQSEAVEITPYTAPPSSPASINDAADIDASAAAVWRDLRSPPNVYPPAYDAILVACFSVHRLVDNFTAHAQLSTTGIFEASVLTAVGLTEAGEKWGIVTTGAFWEDHLTTGVYSYLGVEPDRELERLGKFAGVFSTGLNAGDFHEVEPVEVGRRLREATGRLLATGPVRCVVMGCGGMAGLEEVIREEARRAYGEKRAKELFVVDGVKAGVLQLEQAVRSRNAFRG